MKKRALLLASLFFCSAQSLWAESKTGGVDLSGNVDVVVGYQHDDSKALGTLSGGQLGSFRGSTAAKHDTFNFYLDQVELNINKSFGENIRLRADLDFGRVLSGSGRNTDTGLTGSNFEIEQAYVTLNLKGAELAIGRFNAPIGYYLIDRPENPTISFSPTFNLLPGNMTGAKLFYAFNDHFDINVYAVNSLADEAAFGSGTAGGTANPGGFSSYSAIPSYGVRIGFNWGSEDKKSTFGLAYAGGPERFGCNAGTTGCNAHLTHIAAFDLSYKITPSLLLAADGLYRQDNAVTTGVKNDKAFGAFALLDYAANDAWHFYVRYGYVQDRTGFYFGSSQNIHDFALGAGYQITDGAKIKLEYSPTLFDSRTSGVKSSLSHGFAAEFAYFF